MRQVKISDLGFGVFDDLAELCAMIAQQLERLGLKWSGKITSAFNKLFDPKHLAVSWWGACLYSRFLKKMS